MKGTMAPSFRRPWTSGKTQRESSDASVSCHNLHLPCPTTPFNHYTLQSNGSVTYFHSPSISIRRLPGLASKPHNPTPTQLAPPLQFLHPLLNPLHHRLSIQRSPRRRSFTRIRSQPGHILGALHIRRFSQFGDASVVECGAEDDGDGGFGVVFCSEGGG